MTTGVARVSLLLLGGISAICLEAAPPQSAAQEYSGALMFSGYEWRVKSSTEPVGPGPNHYGTDTASVDAAGRLHLTVVPRAGRWVCAEIVSIRTFGYGEFAFVVRQTSALDRNVVLGLFLWDDTDRANHFGEVDIEISRWGDAALPNAQFVKQPHETKGNVDRFELPRGRAQLSFSWLPGRLQFGAIAAGRRVRQRLFTDGVFTPRAQQVRMNLWLYQGRAPANGRTQEIVVESFHYNPAAKDP